MPDETIQMEFRHRADVRYGAPNSMVHFPAPCKNTESLIGLVPGHTLHALKRAERAQKVAKP